MKDSASAHGMRCDRMTLSRPGARWLLLGAVSLLCSGCLQSVEIYAPETPLLGPGLPVPTEEQLVAWAIAHPEECEIDLSCAREMAFDARKGRLANAGALARYLFRRWPKESLSGDPALLSSWPKAHSLDAALVAEWRAFSQAVAYLPDAFQDRGPASDCGALETLPGELAEANPDLWATLAELANTVAPTASRGTELNG